MLTDPIHWLIVICQQSRREHRNVLVSPSITLFVVSTHFADKLLIRVNSNLLDKLIMGLPRPNWLWSLSIELSMLSGLWFIKLFLCICRKHAHQIELKCGGRTYHGTPWGWLTFAYAHHFLACCWSNSFIWRQATYGIELKLNGWTHYWTLPAWFTPGHVTLNSNNFLAFSWSSSFCEFADNSQID